MRSPDEIDDFVGFYISSTDLTFFDVAEIIPNIFKNIEILSVSNQEIRYKIKGNKGTIVSIDNKK